MALNTRTVLAFTQAAGLVAEALGTRMAKDAAERARVDAERDATLRAVAEYDQIEPAEQAKFAAEVLGDHANLLVYLRQLVRRDKAATEAAGFGQATPAAQPAGRTLKKSDEAWLAHFGRTR